MPARVKIIAEQLKGFTRNPADLRDSVVNNNNSFQTIHSFIRITTKEINLLSVKAVLLRISQWTQTLSTQ